MTLDARQFEDCERRKQFVAATYARPKQQIDILELTPRAIRHTPAMNVLMQSPYVWRQEMIADATAGL